MKAAAWRRHRLLNGLQSLFLLGAMAAILSGLGWVVAGGSGIFWALLGGALLVLFNPGFSPRLVLRMYAARALGPRQAAELTGDPRGLAMALEKMERYQGRFIEQVLFPGRRVPDPSLLRTHPPTKERIRRLLALEPGLTPLDGPRSVPALPGAYPAVDRRPRWHANGMWY